MKSFFYKKREIEFFTTTGEVISSSKYSETHVSGGGSHNHVSVASTTYTNHEFWLSKEDGTEEAIQLCSRRTPALRPGQKITILNSNEKGAKRYFYTSLINHNTKDIDVLMSPEDLRRCYGFYRPKGRSILLAIIVFFLLVQYGTVSDAMFFSVITLVFSAVLRLASAQDVVKKLTNHIEELSEELRQDTTA
ncbi:hypothetical protein [Zooshikella ganghwensis]|uniref:Uncharacterized protein n=1 Tax=Zooshikella ganghwensis TaxID=202772 RepID=A0A4P9VGS2_9GAMM|nr:hypothetical protein [Zooshikella ganghwensis]RDH41564.1 hypothetical protein B9G39_27845 [Zooshikella ganghwensis]